MAQVFWKNSISSINRIGCIYSQSLIMWAGWLCNDNSTSFYVSGVNGSFDFCQTSVKEIFNDEVFNNRILKENRVKLRWVIRSIIAEGAFMHVMTSWHYSLGLMSWTLVLPIRSTGAASCRKSSFTWAGIWISSSQEESNSGEKSTSAFQQETSATSCRRITPRYICTCIIRTHVSWWDGNKIVLQPFTSAIRTCTCTLCNCTSTCTVRVHQDSKTNLLLREWDCQCGTSSVLQTATTSWRRFSQPAVTIWPIESNPESCSAVLNTCITSWPRNACSQVADDRLTCHRHPQVFQPRALPLPREWGRPQLGSTLLRVARQEQQVFTPTRGTRVITCMHVYSRTGCPIQIINVHTVYVFCLRCCLEQTFWQVGVTRRHVWALFVTWERDLVRSYTCTSLM